MTHNRRPETRDDVVGLLLVERYGPSRWWKPPPPKPVTAEEAAANLRILLAEADAADLTDLTDTARSA